VTSVTGSTFVANVFLIEATPTGKYPITHPYMSVANAAGTVATKAHWTGTWNIITGTVRVVPSFSTQRMSSKNTMLKIPCITTADQARDLSVERAN
jgi:hypothetical protein